MTNPTSSASEGQNPTQIPVQGQAETSPQPGRIGSREAKARRPRGSASLFDPKITRRAIVDAFKKLDPRIQARNPVMFVVEVGSVVTTIEWIRALIDPALASERGFVLAVTLWLW